MTAGLPGTGIGGLFYILAALIAPLRGKSKRSALYVAGLAAAVLAGMFATGWVFALILGSSVRPALGAPSARAVLPLRFHPIFHHAQVENILRWASLASSALVLGVVLSFAQLARVLQRRSGK